MPSAAPRCSALSEAAHEPMIATASRVRNWLLIEHDGPWGREAFLDARLPADLGPALVRRTRPHGVRAILIRRGARTAAGNVTAFAVHSGPDRPWIERLSLPSIASALDLDMETLGRGGSIGGEPVADPVFLVCTHGRHDPCCAERGRPLALATAAAFPDATWECSHIGGDRFAGNLVAFPHGLYFGRVAPPDGPRVARAYAEGRIDLDHYRGRSCYPAAVQAAEHFARQSHGIEGIEDVAVQGVSDDGSSTTVILQIPETGLRVRVIVEAGPAERLTCHSEDAQSPPRYRVDEMTPVSGGGSDP
jgi:hypothetical protein